jgi:hypothetical protein
MFNISESARRIAANLNASWFRLLMYALLCDLSMN